MIFTVPFTASARYQTNISDNILEDTAEYIYKTVHNPQVGSIGGEWAVLALARSGYEIPDEYYHNYYENVERYVKSCDGVLSDRKYTEYSRIIIALTSIGKNPSEVGGYNLLMPLSDYEKTIFQGINGAVWALIALDSGNYEIPKNGEADILATRDMYIDYILSCQMTDGGWSATGSDKSEVDITAMAVTALADYTDKPEVAAAVNTALEYLSDVQNDDGTYSTYGIETAESTAQVIVALTENGIPLSDERFIKNGNNLETALTRFAVGDGGFKHTLSDTSSNMMATEQALYAMAAAKRAESGRNRLFDMTDTVRVEFTDTIGLPDKILAVHARERMYDITFSDTYGSRYENEINELATYGIINGKGAGIFEPESNMTRAEFAAIMVNGLCLDKIENDVFSDVTENDWYFESVNTAYSYNIVKGISDTTFNPYGVITKQEAAVMVVRAATLCGIDTEMDDISIRNTLSAFTDYMNTAEWAREALSFCYRTDILDSSEIEINGDSVVTRAEIAHMTYTMLKNANLIK